MNKQKKVRKRTFTLVELLVVLLILGVLVGLAVPRYMESQKAARARTFAANVRQIVSVLEAYRMDTTGDGGPAQYPGTLSDLQTKYFTQEPINPYTGKSMLSNNSADSGLQYQSTGDKYKLCVVQNDIDDINNNGITDELLPLTTSDICFDNTQSQISVNFNRPSVAYTNNGTLVDAGVPRYETGKFGQAIFIEEDTINLLMESQSSVEIGEEANSAGLSRTAANNDAASSAIDTIAWHGGYSYKVISHHFSGFSIYTWTQPTPVTAGTAYTGSVYVKSSNPQSTGFTMWWIRSRYKNQDVPTRTSVNLTTNWKRVVVTGTAIPEAYEAYLEVGSNGYLTIWWDGAQLEAKPYATSWTLGGTKREAETLSISPVSNILTPQQGTIDVWVYVPEFWKSGIPNNRRIWTIGTAMEAGVYYLGYNPTNDQIEFSVVSDVGTAQTITADKPSIGWHLFTTRWSNNKMSLWIDGVMVGSISNPVLPSRFADNKLYLGNMPNISMSAINTYIDDLRISSRARTDAEIQAAYRNNQSLPVDAWTTLKLDFNGDLSTQSGVIP